MHVICFLIDAYIVVVFARVLLSWFPIRPDTFLAQVNGVLVRITEPLMAPLRRVIPPIGMLDVSTVVLIFGLFILQAFVCRSV